jgi:pimeloyl-ACP methyl ester carboxylesterase
MLYVPSHHSMRTGLNEWKNGDTVIGYCREVPEPEAIWMMLHGNGGQAAHREQTLQCLSAKDSFYVLEYPGYGLRNGKTTRASIDAAAAEAYQMLRAQHPGTPVCVIGESLGSGPASFLAQQETPPDKIVLVVPYDELANVGKGRFPFLPVRWLMLDNWDNIDSLQNYTGPIDIFATREDRVVPFKYAESLAAEMPAANFTVFSGGHNSWTENELVRIRR